MPGLSELATWNMILFVRLRSANAANEYVMKSGVCPASRGIG